MKRVNIKCPYCGARAFLRPASVVYGERAAPGSKLYVCGNYPACDSYVAAHRTSQLPMGTLADTPPAPYMLLPPASTRNLKRNACMSGC